MASPIHKPGDPVYQPTEPVYKPTSVEFRTDPWPFYELLRDQAPVLYTAPDTDEGEHFYALTRFDDVAEALRDKKRYSSYTQRGGFLDLPIMINRNAPDHTRLRRITNRGFGPRALATLQEWMQQKIGALVDEVLSQPKVEFVEQFTTELPMRVVGEMVGIPIDRKHDIQRGSEAALEVALVVGGADPDLVPGFYEDYLNLVDFIDGLANERVGCPNRGDILGDLVCREAAGELSHDELVGLGWNYISAGQDTTLNLLGGGVHMLLTHPELAERLAAEPERTDDFMEEYLRLYSPVQFVLRRLDEDVELHGTLMEAGSLVHLVIAAANRDPRKFPHPDVFDLDRPDLNDHVAFGAGPHFCPGTALGRVMARTAFLALYPHLHRLSLDPEDPPELRIRPGAYGIEHMGMLISQHEPAQALG